MPDNKTAELLFIINPSSGTKSKTNWKQTVNEFFRSRPESFQIYELTGGENDNAELKNQLAEIKPKKVIAVGGDGTVKMVAEQLLHTEMALGILPAGSANGMAKELNIPDDIAKAFDIILNGNTEKIDVLKVNDDNISIHLSDMGLNALLIHYFEKGNQRGMWGYAKVAFKVLLRKRLMRLDIKLNGENILRAAYMVVLANAKKYGTGAEINPEGKLTDGKFEVVIVRKLTVLHLFRMLVSHKPFNRDCIEILQTEKVVITSNKKNHFQVDGEYCGKTNTITAEIIAASLKVLIPAEK
jgi:diacylglycerol kinase (ATP)